MQDFFQAIPWQLILNVAVFTALAIFYRVFYKKNEQQSFYKPFNGNDDTLIILCVKDEDTKRLLETIRGIVSSSADFIVVDDGSQIPLKMFDDRTFVRKATNGKFLGLLHNEVNIGKKLSQNRAVSYLEEQELFEKYKYVVSVDSDTVLDPDAIDCAKRLFYPQTGAVVGDIRVGNSWMIDALYWQSFNIMRAIATLVGQVPVCSGAFTVYRADLFSRIIKESSKRKINGGEDRYLTYLLLKMGYETLYSYKAQAMTYTPKGLAFIKQQLRWQRSFWRGLVYSFDAYKKNWFLAFLNIFSAISRAVSITFFFFFWFLLFTGQFSWAIMIVFMIIIHCHWSGLYGLCVKKHNDFAMFALPLWGLYSFFVISPLNIWALLTIKNDGWGNR